MAMEVVRREEVCLKVNSKFGSSRYAKLALEDYLHFFDSRSFSDFSINYLNQIIAMHGYKRIHKTPKKVLIEAMSAIALANPCRSTLNDKISTSEPAASAAETLQSVIKDLSELNWQECTITSVESIGSNSRSLTIASSSGGPAGPKKRRGKGAKGKRIALKPKGNEIVSASGEGKRSKRAAKRKKLCDCKGCVSAGDL